MKPSPTRFGGETFHVHACGMQEVMAQKLYMTSFGPVLTSPGCGMLLIYCGAQLVQCRNRFLPVRVFDGWSEGLPISIRSYRGKTRILSCVNPKQLVPHKTCVQQVVLLRVGTGGRLCLLTCPFLSPPNQPANIVIIRLAAVWLHNSWATFGSV